MKLMFIYVYLNISVVAVFEMGSFFHRSFEPCVQCKISIPLQPEVGFRSFSNSAGFLEICVSIDFISGFLINST